MSVIDQRVKKLREKMQENSIDAYIVPTSDPHMSEYNAKHYEARHFISGFTGSAGTALVTRDKAYLWTDGRYFIQAEKQLKDSEFELMKLNTANYPTLLEYLNEHLDKGATVAVNGEVLSQAQAEKYQESLAKKDISLELDHKLVSEIWEEQPALPKEKIFLLDEKWTGRSLEDKLKSMRKAMSENDEDYNLIGSLDDIAWLYNYRGNDILYTPVAYAYTLVSQDEAILFIDLDKVAEEVRKTLEADGVTLKDYTDIFEVISSLKNVSLRLDKSVINSLVYSYIDDSVEVINKKDWTLLEKAIKNDTEIKNQYEAYRKDGLAITRLIYWLKHEDVNKLSELDVSRKSLELRQELDTFLELSFTTIAAYEANAAMAHYAPTKDDYADLKDKGFILVDSGGQYYEGTTDTTRTIAIGPLSDEEIHDYTLTLKAHINLARAVFLKGATGYQLDMLARAPMWREHVDFKHGTGHGIGYLLNVHEGPQSINTSKYNLNPMLPGMITSNEPGVYKEGKHGVRLESVVVCVEDGKVGSDEFLRFETMTRVPLEREAIDKSLLTEEEIAWVNDYHQACYESHKDYLSTEEAAWLKDVCRPL